MAYSSYRSSLIALWVVLLTGLTSVQVLSAPRFTDENDGTVTDNTTGLVWLKDANCSAKLNGINKTGALFNKERNRTLTWSDAVTWVTALESGYCDLRDGSRPGQWRLPSLSELQSLFDYSVSNQPILPAGYPFTGVQFSNGLTGGSYWSSTRFMPSNSAAWSVDFGGAIMAFSKDSESHVWPVRDRK
ncbi:MAG: hypothetical protein QG639_613 [Patescibacteria group bacterium]|nr:hypothetical protein [Patescibacteria group bacterium]